jgi:hypothetical protein
MEHPIVIDQEGDVFSLDDFNQKLASLIKALGNKPGLSNSMASVIRRNLDYQGIARKTLAIQTLPNGVNVIYDKDA